MTRSSGFPPVAHPDASILILGSLPGQRSIAEQQYYAHPQNAFWRIMAALFGIEGEYTARCRQLTDNRIALWDVLMSSVRPGSMDADIRMTEAMPNDFEGFFAEHPSIDLIAFNGGKAEQLFGRLVEPSGIARDIRQVRLPSTSPAYASMTLEDKLAAWRRVLLYDR
jgi:double-stranded uracil-DNA glycosylase